MAEDIALGVEEEDDVDDLTAAVARTDSGAVSAEAREKARKRGHTMPDGSFPIEDAEDLRNAIQSVGRAKDPEAARRHIIRQAKRLDREDLIPESWNADGTVKESVTAAADTHPPIDWFRDPGLDGPTPLTVTDEGRVFGHLATWDSRHIGFPGQSITPPRSQADYAYFHTGSRLVADGDEVRPISTGHITLDTGHAGIEADARAAAAHYDDTGTLVADVCAGEDEHGIWVAGAVVPGLDELRLHKLRACGLSGDWRRIGTGLELVAALSVPTPGFPIPRARVASGEPLAMVAAGALSPGQTAVDVDAIAAAVVGRLDQRERDQQERDALIAELLSETDAERAERAELVAALTDTEEDDEERAILLATLLDDDEDLALLTADAVPSLMPPQLQKSYLVGKVARRIQWRTPGDFRRCVIQARAHGMGRKAEGACAVLHKKANGFWPGDRRNR